MCGLTGFIDLERRLGVEQLAPITERMTDTIAHRGPDDAAVWVDTEAHLAFGFRRLSNIDVSPVGRHPKHSATGRFVIVYNVEINKASSAGASSGRSTELPACSPSPCGTGKAAA